MLAIDSCYAQLYVTQPTAQLQQANTPLAPGQTPAPAPTFDNHALRLCFVAASVSERVNPEIKKHPAILALGRTCEKFDDTGSDEAIAAYQKCIINGMPAALRARP